MSILKDIKDASRPKCLWPHTMILVAATMITLAVAGEVWSLSKQETARVADTAAKLETHVKETAAALEKKNAEQDTYLQSKVDLRDKQFLETQEQFGKVREQAASNGTKLDMALLALERIERRIDGSAVKLGMSGDKGKDATP